MSSLQDNPYQPPEVADAPVSVVDFRDWATQWSRQIVEASSGIPAEDIGLSLCLPMNPEASFQHVRVSTILHLVFGVLGLLLGAAVISLTKFFGEQLWIGVLSVCCMVVGMISLGTVAFSYRRFTKRQLGSRYEKLCEIESPLKALCVGVEDSVTFTKMKLVPDDFVWLVFDVHKQRLLLEGIRYRYIIHASDIVSVNEIQGSTTTGVAIAYRVGNSILTLALQYDSLRYELRRQTIGGVNPLMKPIMTTITNVNC